ncbi:MAG: NADH-quinone oxidoreductase subunit F, partial [Deltaproteobacteria bacterium]|nr:NADH-quinone oxidoreductase subunit F [Deltaproteobacteria bacterium]
MNPPKRDSVQEAFAALRDEAVKRSEARLETGVPRIHIGMATCGIASGALETRAAFEEILKERNIEAGLHSVGCIGHCYAEPIVVVENPGFPPLLYYRVTPGKARMIVRSFLQDGDPLFEVLLGAMEENDLIPAVTDFARFNRERRVVTEHCGRIDPEDIYEYIASGGYESLVQALQGSP